MATPAVGNVTAGPAQVKLADTEIGHTEGGVVVTITPQNRARIVDQFGQAEVAILHQGDLVRVVVPWAEWTADVLAEVYNPGDDQTAAASGEKFMGIGRSAGFIYTTQDLKVIPRLTADIALRLQMFLATPMGELVLNHNDADDRIFSTEFACLVDESKTDGQLIGKIALTTV